MIEGEDWLVNGEVEVVVEGMVGVFVEVGNFSFIVLLIESVDECYCIIGC